VSAIKTGGPAFPTPDVYHTNGQIQYGEVGMSLRDYFIAHAPTEPPTWFQPSMPVARPASRYTSEDGKMNYPNRHAAACAEGDFFINTAEKAQIDWDALQVRERSFQWPVAWADAMLKARAV
jgi:hypothetical protein